MNREIELKYLLEDISMETLFEEVYETINRSQVSSLIYGSSTDHIYTLPHKPKGWIRYREDESNPTLTYKEVDGKDNLDRLEINLLVDPLGDPKQALNLCNAFCTKEGTIHKTYKVIQMKGGVDVSCYEAWTPNGEKITCLEVEGPSAVSVLDKAYALEKHFGDRAVRSFYSLPGLLLGLNR